MNTLSNQILRLLSRTDYRPLDKNELARKVRATPDDKSELRHVLAQMEQAGQIVCIKNRYCLPKTADLVTGTILMNEKGFGFVVPEVLPGGDKTPDIFIAPHNTSTALHKDKVLVRIDKKAKRPLPSGGRDRQSGKRPRGKSDLKPRGREEKEKLEGTVLKIIERVRSQIVGTLQKSKNFHYVVPDDPRIFNDIYVQPFPGAQVGDKVVVKLHEWTNRHVNPEGEITEILGKAGDPSIDIIAIIRKYDLPTEFPNEVISEAERIPATVPPEVLRKRRDLRQEFIITIDPDDAKDYDDAVQVEHLKNGDWFLGVHIADVSHYVRPGTEMDREARERGNSVYLADRVLPMLPERLSNGICSLKEGVDRLVKSAFITFSKTGQIKKYEFAESVIRSRKRLTYKQAFALLNGADEIPPNPFAYKMDNTPLDPGHCPPPVPELREKLREMWALASLLRRERFEKGSLDLEFPEVKVWVDQQGIPVKLEKVENDISHQLIEEFMLAANEVTALDFKNRDLPAIYRVHEAPDPGRLDEFREVLIAGGIQVGDLTKRTEIVRFLKLIKGLPEEYSLKLGLLKSLKRACYGVKPLGHYGLHKVNYTHFTSPIRRYSDLIVHRIVASICGGEPYRPRPGDMAATAEHISRTERTASEAEQESVKLKKLQYFVMQNQSDTKQAFDAMVTDVRNYGMMVELPEFLIHGLVPLSAIEDDFYIFDEARAELRGRQTKKTFRLGDRIKVVVAKVDFFKQQVDFAPAQTAGSR
ncbi:MAG: ribonuclease R [Verrucomicrobiae bacterium]|nr:ribonuclease R [Verrucomicrobiae bacterium]